MRLGHLSLLALVLTFGGCKATGGERPSSDGGEAAAEHDVPEAEVAHGNDEAPAPTTGEGATVGGGDTSDAETLVDASTICKDLVDPNGEGIEIIDCAFLPGGNDLSAEVRFDLLKVHFVDGAFGDLEQIYAVLRSGDEVSDELVAESSEVPGESVTGTVGKIEFEPGKTKVASQEEVSTTGNTGDPDPAADPEQTVEITKFTTVCLAQDLTCEREPIDE